MQVLKRTAEQSVDALRASALLPARPPEPPLPTERAAVASEDARFADALLCLENTTLPGSATMSQIMRRWLATPQVAGALKPGHPGALSALNLPTPPPEFFEGLSSIMKVPCIRSLHFTEPGSAEGSPNSGTPPMHPGKKRKLDDTERPTFQQNLRRVAQKRADAAHLYPNGVNAATDSSFMTGGQDGYIISESLTQGTYGKFRLAMNMQGELFGIKEIRSERAPKKTGPRKKGKKRRTAVTPQRVFDAEVHLLNTISRHLPVREIIDVKGKCYAVMPLMAGDVYDLVRAPLQPEERRALARSLAFQLTGDLEMCHAAGYIHNDLKLLNALWNRAEVIAASDYGLAQRLNNPYRHMLGTPGYTAPERIAGEVYGCNADMWSLGVAFFDFLLSDLVNPLGWRGHTETARLEAHRLMNSFFAWRESVLNREGEVAAVFLPLSDPPFGPYFLEAYTRDPHMTMFMLNHVLVPAVQRLSSHEARIGIARVRGDTQSDDRLCQQACERVAAGDTQREKVIDTLQAHRATVLVP